MKESSRAADVDAIYSNHITMTLHPYGVRLAFGEKNSADSEELYHSAVYLPIDEAEQFQRFLGDKINEMKAAQSKGQKSN